MKQLLFLLLAINLYALDFDSIVTEVKQHEGFRYKPYVDGSHYSVGYGTNLSYITKAEAHLLLVHRLSMRQAQLQQHEWYNKLNPTRQYVLLSMAYQLGYTGLMQFKHTIWRIKHGYYKAAGNSMQDSLWFKQSGNRSRELVKLMKRGY